MWEIFQSTGHIGAYLAYRSCIEPKGSGETNGNFKNNMEYM
ncbi:hypothetical protein SDC9_08954 [bioreactor metagenome]|uniref:YqzL family protein n=1 Tax=bioreactor metagenome TaxID=1076179 RepID=A0A644T8U2_9ZZZZ